jgi:hypothetical protein
MQAYFLVGSLDFEPGRNYVSFRTSGMDNQLTWRQVPGERIAKLAERETSKKKKKSVLAETSKRQEDNL